MLACGLYTRRRRPATANTLKPKLPCCRGMCSLSLTPVCGKVLNKTNTLVGTPEYIAPEVIDIPHEHDVSVDWWALGVMVYDACLPAVHPRVPASNLCSLCMTNGMLCGRVYQNEHIPCALEPALIAAEGCHSEVRHFCAAGCW